MSDQKKQKRVEWKAVVYKAADKTGHFLRKAGPVLFGSILVFFSIRKKDGTSKT